jgi:hypothetical protein
MPQLYWVLIGFGTLAVIHSGGLLLIPLGLLTAGYFFLKNNQDRMITAIDKRIYQQNNERTPGSL